MAKNSKITFIKLYKDQITIERDNGRRFKKYSPSTKRIEALDNLLTSDNYPYSYGHPKAFGWAVNLLYEPDYKNPFKR